MGTEIDNRIASQVCADRLPQFPYAQCQQQVEAIPDPQKEAKILNLFRRVCGGNFYDKKTGRQYDKNSPEVAGCVTGQMRQWARTFSPPTSATSFSAPPAAVPTPP